MTSRPGACATSHPAAVEAGLELLRRGGSAVDAAVGMAAALTVVEPTSNGLGSDAFALIWSEGRLHGLNGSGPSPARLVEVEDDIPPLGWASVTVPGAPRAWSDLHGRFGKLPFEQVLAPAIELARDGCPVPPVVAHHWGAAFEKYGSLGAPEFSGWMETFAPGGHAPDEGDVFKAPGHAATLLALAQSGCDDFYTGGVARQIVEFAAKTGGTLSADDLAGHQSLWVEPISIPYRNAEVWEIPPNTQGIAALSALGMLAELAPPESPVDEPSVHRAMEAIKLAFADAQAHVADPFAAQVEPRAFLDAAYLKQRAGLIGEQAEVRQTGLPRRGGTVYLAAADGDGMMVSFIQSNYMGFGSGVVVPGTGVALQNRGHGFTLEAGHPNVRAPKKRPFHTIIPGFLTRDGKPWGPFGVMGGHMQPQGHVQVVQAMVDGGLSPQKALDLPRWYWHKDQRVYFETTPEFSWPESVLAGIEQRGHELKRHDKAGLFGRGQIILLENGEYIGGSDRRADGCVGTT